MKQKPCQIISGLSLAMLIYSHAAPQKGHFDVEFQCFPLLCRLEPHFSQEMSSWTSELMLTSVETSILPLLTDSLILFTKEKMNVESRGIRVNASLDWHPECLFMLPFIKLPLRQKIDMKGLFKSSEAVVDPVSKVSYAVAHVTCFRAMTLVNLLQSSSSSGNTSTVRIENDLYQRFPGRLVKVSLPAFQQLASACDACSNHTSLATPPRAFQSAVAWNTLVLAHNITTLLMGCAHMPEINLL